jgi:hypothetical protein
MNITRARIVINGSQYNVILRTGQIVTGVLGEQNSSSVLVDLSPTIVPIYINGVTVLIMSAQVGSIFLNQSGVQDNQSSSPGGLSKNELNALKVKLLNPQVYITSPELTTINGTAGLALTVTNGGNKTVVLHDILVLGSQELVNSTGSYAPAASFPVAPNHIGAEFAVGQNGTLSFANPDYLPTSLERINYVYPYDTSGYTLGPNSSVTLTYSGGLDISNSTEISLIKGTSYKISVLGDYVAHLSVNVTSG